jgi:hypothetical protein
MPILQKNQAIHKNGHRTKKRPIENKAKKCMRVLTTLQYITIETATITAAKVMVKYSPETKRENTIRHMMYTLYQKAVLCRAVGPTDDDAQLVKEQLNIRTPPYATNISACFIVHSLHYMFRL